MRPILQAKIPKMFAWQMIPECDFYIWCDACITLSHHDTVAWLLEQLGDADIAFFKHPEGRNSVQSELDYMENCMNTPGAMQGYLMERYHGEPMRNQVETYLKKPGFVDDHLYAGGVFIYRNNVHTFAMLESWFMQNLLHSIQDQLSLPYVLAQSNCEVKTIDENIYDNIYVQRHRGIVEDNTSKWDCLYTGMDLRNTIHPYGDSETYKFGADFLKDCETVEDWGTGGGGFKRYRANAIGIDGSDTPYADVKADLKTYRSGVDGIFMRHILEHNYEWKAILKNALDSAGKKLVVVLFTPIKQGDTIEFTEDTKQNQAQGIDVPVLSLGRQELYQILLSYGCQVEEQGYATESHYGSETVLLITKGRS